MIKPSVKSWLEKATVTGAELRDILAEIPRQDAITQRTSAYIVQGVTLKAQIAAPQRL